MSWFDDMASSVNAWGQKMQGTMGDIGKWAGASVDAFTGKAQVDAMREANATNIDLANTAVQRRAEDMRKAGVNPMLAAGSPAGGSVQSVGGGSAGDPIGAVMGLLQGVTSIQKTIADASLAEMQKGKVQSETTGQDLANSLASAANPLKLTAMQLENNLNSELNPEKIRQMGEVIKGLGLDNVNKALESSRIKANTSLAWEQSDSVMYDVLQKRFFQTGLDQNGKPVGLSVTPQMADALSKIYAMKVAGIDANNLEQFYSTAPSGSMQWLQVLKTVLGALK